MHRLRQDASLRLSNKTIAVVAQSNLRFLKKVISCRNLPYAVSTIFNRTIRSQPYNTSLVPVFHKNSGAFDHCLGPTHYLRNDPTADSILRNLNELRRSLIPSVMGMPFAHAKDTELSHDKRFMPAAWFSAGAPFFVLLNGARLTSKKSPKL